MKVTKISNDEVYQAGQSAQIAEISRECVDELSSKLNGVADRFAVSVTVIDTQRKEAYLISESGDTPDEFMDLMSECANVGNIIN